jgi:hypothetical protein
MCASMPGDAMLPGRIEGTAGACFITQGASASCLPPLQQGQTYLGVTVLSTYILGSSIFCLTLFDVYVILTIGTHTD